MRSKARPSRQVCGDVPSRVRLCGKRAAQRKRGLETGSKKPAKRQERSCARRFASRLPEPEDSLRGGAAAGASGPGAVAPSELALPAGAGDRAGTIQNRRPKSPTRPLRAAGPTIGNSSSAGGRGYWVHAWIEWSVECQLGQTQPRVSVHGPARSKCESGTANTVRRGSAIRGRACTRRKVLTVCEGHLGTHLIPRISRARSRIGVAVSGGYLLSAPESRRLCRGSLAGRVSHHGKTPGPDVGSARDRSSGRRDRRPGDRDHLEGQDCVPDHGGTVRRDRASRIEDRMVVGHLARPSRFRDSVRV